MNNRETLIAYIQEHVDEDFEENEELLDYMDSVTLLQFIVFIEQSFRVTINQADLTLEAFENIDSVLETFIK
jgi:acyl carrier protein